MKKFITVLLSIFLIFSTSLSAMAQNLLISSVTKEGENWVVKGTWDGNKPLTVEVLKQGKAWADVSSAGDIDILNYLAYFNQADNKDGSFEFKIANLSAEPEVRVYTNGEYFYHSRDTLNEINAASDATFYDSIMGYGFLDGIITDITGPLNNDEKTEFWNRIFTYKENKTGGFANFGDIVTSSREIAALIQVKHSDSAGLKTNLELLTSYGINQSDSWDIYTNQGEFAKEDYLTAAQEEILIAALKGKAGEVNSAYDFIEYFNNKVVLTACHNNVTDYLVRDIISKCDVILKEDTGKYSSLTSVQKLGVAKIINDSQSEFATVSQLAQKVLSESGKIADTPSDSNDSGKRGSSGAGFSVTTKPVEVVPPQDSGAIFTDIANYQWAETAIYALQEKGIVQGTGAQTFEPERSVTREEFVKMLVLAAGVMADNAVAPFEDVAQGAWYVPYIASAYNSGLVAGVTDTTFGIGSCITREQLAVMVHRAIATKGTLQSVDSDATFADFSSVSDFAKDAVTYVNAAGIMNGMGDGSFAPQMPVNRAQAAKVIYELITRL